MFGLICLLFCALRTVTAFAIEWSSCLTDKGLTNAPSDSPAGIMMEGVQASGKCIALITYIRKRMQTKAHTMLICFFTIQEGLFLNVVIFSAIDIEPYREKT